MSSAMSSAMNSGHAFWSGNVEATRLVRRQPRRAGFRLNFGRHHALGTGSEPHQHILAGTQLGHSEAAEGFHVHENVRRPLAAGQEAEAAQAVEPLDLR